VDAYFDGGRRRVSEIFLENIHDSSFVDSFMNQISTDGRAGKIEMKWVKRLYNDLLSRMIHKRTSGTAQDHRLFNPYGRNWRPGNVLVRHGLQHFSVPRFLRWLEDCRALGITVGHVLSQLNAWVLSTEDLDVAFHSVMLPVVKGLVANLGSDYAAVVTAGLTGSDIRELLYVYKSRYVLKEPAKAVMVSFQPIQSPCPCAECQTFNLFLRDRDQIKCEIRANKLIRDNVERYLPPNHPVLVWETIKDRSPHMLRITFRNRDAEVKHREWEGRAKKAVRQIQSLGAKSTMEAIIQPEDYRALLRPDGMVMTPSELARYTRSLGAIENQKATLLNLPRNTIAGQKRPSTEPESRPSKKPFTEVVDLT
jgi:hypothetical protein